jgi:hypothetical protein
MFVAISRAVILEALSAPPRPRGSGLRAAMTAGLLLLSLPDFIPAARPADSSALLLMEEVRRLQATSYWPGFAPGSIPAAVFDGSDTYLFDFPPDARPPRGFRPLAGQDGILVFPGQHPAVIGNRRIRLDGFWVATAVPGLFTSGRERPFTLTETAAVLIHEKFHVFQALRHPDWKPNDLVLFDFPADTTEAVALRKMEIETLRRALAAATDEDARGWARASLDIRRHRLAALPARHARYEREVQRLEGLAEYVEFLARGRGLADDFPASGFAPAAAREMGYGLGRWTAALLTRFDPGWPEALESGAFAYPEQRLEALLRGRPAGCALPPDEETRFRREAAAALERKDRERAALVADFTSRMGTAIEIDAQESPLHVDMFDPFTVEAVGAGRMIHTQWLILKNDNGIIQVYDRPCLTEVNDRLQVVRLILTGISVRRPLALGLNRAALAREGIVAAFRNVRVSERVGRYVLRLRK